MKEGLQERQNIEIEYWKTSLTERPDGDSLDVLTTKFSDMRVFLNELNCYRQFFARAESILELGGGQCWASCAVKKLFPSSRLFASDLSEHAVASAKKWERILQVSLDKVFACKSYEIPLESESLDLVFCYASAHHFVAHRRTLTEIYRVLNRNGICLYLHEPSCRSFIYPLAYRRVNKKRPEVPEDVLIYRKLAQIGRSIGFKCECHFDPTPLNRAPFETVYYLGLQKIPFLKHILPCTMNYVFAKCR